MDARTALESEIQQLQQSLTDLTSAVEAQAQQLQAQISQHDAQFRTSQEQREQEFNQRREELEADFQQALAVAEEKAEKTIVELRDTVSSTVEDIDRAKEGAEVLLDAIGRTGTEFGFKEYAQEEKNQADFWRWVAAGALVAIAAIGLAVLFFMDPQRADPGVLALRLLITVPLGALAAYAGRQSHHHRENERAARSLHLDIAAIDPYIALLPEKARDEIKARMALRIFGHRYLFSSDMKTATVNPAEGLVDTISETLRRTSKDKE